MREIRFRAWDSYGKKMIEPFEIGSLISSEIGGLDDEYPLMQYTGLKDKNGKEIYEGDVVKHEGGNLAVGWCEQEVGFRLYKGFIYRESSEPNVSEWHIEIIGNIYENPELLRGK